MTQKHLFQLLLPAAGIQLAVLHGAPSRLIRLVPPLEDCRLPPRPSGSSGRPLTRIDPAASGPPPSLHGHYPASTLLWSSPSLTAASVLSASWDHHLCLFPSHRRSGSQVPYESPNESHASCTPDTTWTVSRFLPCCSRRTGEAPVLVPSEILSMLHQRFACARLSRPYMT